MPRIDAPTVVEHHAQRRAALLAAAEELLAESGVDAVTPAAVGARAGLARSSVYQYFASGPAIIAAVVEDAFPRATEQLRAAMAAATTPERQVDAYVRTALALADDRTHRSLRALSAAELPEECRSRMDELHRAQTAPLVEALEEMDVADSALTARLVSGVVRAAAQAVAEGAPAARVTRRTLALIHEGIGA
ncbi:MAG TPA: TetR/AcrR family transcriptional regulator [Candidatus Nanopelagicales bacterium]|nr:TetR/AcrR family transcriptional regulator [Candidatus Nanopelagicales bacterium]